MKEGGKLLSIQYNQNQNKFDIYVVYQLTLPGCNNQHIGQADLFMLGFKNIFATTNTAIISPCSRNTF